MRFLLNDRNVAGSDVHNIIHESHCDLRLACANTKLAPQQLLATPAENKATIRGHKISVKNYMSGKIGTPDMI